MDKRTILWLALFSLVLFGVNIYFTNKDQERLKEWNAQQAKKVQTQQNTNSQNPTTTTTLPSTTNTNFQNTQESQNSSNLKEKSKEQYYVLENEYIQLVFSNYGGALAEVNLPYESKENKASVVKEIQFDRDIIKQHPADAYFPMHPYTTANSDQQTTEYSEGQFGGYYPLFRRDLAVAGNNPKYKTPSKIINIPPRYYGLNIVSDYPELAELVYTVKSFTDKSITFEATQPYRRITKTFTLPENPTQAPYCFNLTIKVEGDSKGLWLTSGVPEAEWLVGSIAPALKFHITRQNKLEVESIDLPKETLTVTSIVPDWVSNSNGFLGIIMDPLTQMDAGYRAQYIAGTTVPSRLTLIDQEYERFKSADLPGYMTYLPLNSAGGEMELRVFTGPFAENILKTIEGTFTDATANYNPDYIKTQSFQGWFSFISEPFAKFLFILMKFFHFITGSWGFSIILLTVVLRILLYPLNAWSTKSMIRMQEIAPLIAQIQEKNKKDPKKGQMEIMNLYREKKINPMSGCLPLLIQMPFLIGMFDLLKSTFELRGASFIPGWINDLSAPDVVLTWPYHIFFIGNSLHLLPIILAFVMYAQQRYMSGAPATTGPLTDQQKQQKTMANMMTIIFAVMFYHFPSGLNIYWLSSMLLGMLQQWYMTKQMRKAKEKGKVEIIDPRKKTTTN